MEQAHCRLLMLKRARLNDRAYKHFRKTAAYGIKYCTDYYSCKRIGCDLRKKSKSDKSDRRKQLRTNNTISVAYSICKTCTQNINNKLCNKKHR